MDNSNEYLEHIEWEALNTPCEIDDVDQSDNIPQKADKIRLWRNELYKLNASISGTSNISDRYKPIEDSTPGKRIVPFVVKGYSHHRTREYELDQCYIGAINKKMPNEGMYKYEADLHVHGINIKSNNDLDIDWLTDWYLNGSGDILYPRSTERKTSNKYERKRDSIDEKTGQYNGGYVEAYSRDYALVQADKIKFLVTHVPKGIGPTWSDNIGIEYRKSFGEIPKEEERKCISEIISFIIGRHLILVGSTEYNVDGFPLRQIALSPWYSNAMHICQKPDYAPIDLSFKDREWNKIERILGSIIPTYLKLREELNLTHALWRYWISKDSPIGANLPILAAGIEMIAQAWFLSKESKIKGVYMDKDKYDELLKDEIENISDKLSKVNNGEKMLNKIKNAYNLGSNDRLLLFINEIGLKIGAVEESAIKARNLMAHGYVPKDDREWDEMIQKTYVYDTLFNRVVLKILGYEGNYIDRSVVGWPERHIDSPMGSE